MATLSDAHNLCPFCYKSILIEQNQQNTKIVHKFTKLLANFLNESDEKFRKLLLLLPSSILKFCKDCENLVVSFCKVYHGIKCLELKLLLKLETLVKVMESADRVSSRVKYMQQCFQPDEGIVQINSTSTKNIESFQSLRTEIIKNCHRSRTLPQLQPRVILQKLVQDNVTNSVHCKSENIAVSQLPETTQQFDQHLFTEWLISFAALVSLVYPSNCDGIVGDITCANNLMVTDDEVTVKVGLFNSKEQMVDESETEIDDPLFSNVIEDEETNLSNDILATIGETTYEENSNSGHISDKAIEDNNDLIVDRQEVQGEAIHDIETPTVIPNIITKQKIRPFPCSRCKLSFRHDRALKNHMKRRHRGIHPGRYGKTDKHENLIFHCGICKTSHSSFERLRIHKYSAFHQYLERKTYAKIKKEKLDNVQEKVHSSISNHFDSDSKSSHDNNTKGNMTESNIKRYNLRLKQKRSYVVNKDDPEDLPEANATNKDNSDDNFSNLSSSSEDEETESDQDSVSSISSHDEIEEVDDTNGRVYYCTLDDCKYRVPAFTDKLRLNEHQKLHKRGEYRCNFCDKIEDTVILLGLHESKMHSNVSSSSGINLNVFKCARCSYESKLQALFLKHFASKHLGIYNLSVGKVKQETWQCEICKVKFKMTKNIGRKTELHFKTHHDKNGLDNPEKQVKNCELNGCQAYFLSCEQLRLHRERQHTASSLNLQSRKRKLDGDNEVFLEDLEIDSLKCSLCQKTFSSLRYLLQHKQTFHVTESTIVPKEKQENDDDCKPSWKRIVCPEVKCTKSFLTRKALEVHKSLHGIFFCELCDNETDYAPNLAFHEYEMHSIRIKEEQQQAVKKFQANKKRYKCPRCPKVMLNRLAYLKHFVNDHLGLSTVHAVCSICKHTSHEESLRRHNLESHYTADMDVSKIVKCKICPAYFRKETQLIRHIRIVHSNESIDNELNGGHMCSKCGRVFRSQSGLKLHLTVAHSGKQDKKVKNAFHCVLDKCKRMFDNKILLDRHQKLHERGNYPCQFCDKVLNTIINLSMHEAKEHPSQNLIEDQLYQCSRCSFNNKSVVLFQNHFASIHMNIYLRQKPKKNYKEPVELKCMVCDLEFDSGLELATHEALHSNKSTKRTKCSRCTGTFRGGSYVNHFIKKHLSGRIERKRKMCTICQTTHARLANHYKLYHKTDNLDDTSKIYKCEENLCKAYFLKGEQLIRHKIKVHSSSDTTCKECGKKMKTKTTLQNHMKQFHSYLDEKLPLACDVPNCKKRFSIDAELEWHKKYDRHQKNLSSEKLKCDKCGNEFANKNKLQGHLNMVHPNRMFICPECGKSFKTKAGLDIHLEYHKSPDDWKFECSACGKKCATKYLLKDHMKTHTKEKPFVCQYCGEKYAHQHNWKNHMLTKHKNEDNLPTTMKSERRNNLSRKGTKKGDCILAGVKQ